MGLDYSIDSTPWICAALNILMYLRFDVKDGITIGELCKKMTLDLTQEANAEEAMVASRSFHVFRIMASRSTKLNDLVIDKQTWHMGYAREGLNAAVFTGTCGRFLAIRGTGHGEWNDNAIALLGIPQINPYYEYDASGNRVAACIREEQVSAQQAQALDYFHRITKQLNWTQPESIVVTGHSKGGNKAQIITLLSDRIKECYSFYGQGFSPEFILEVQAALGENEYQKRTKKMYAISSYNDFVNAMGDAIIPIDNRYYIGTETVTTPREFHELASVVSLDGALHTQRKRGDLSLAAEKMWEETKNSDDRLAVCMTIMTVCSHRYGNGLPINGEFISTKLLRTGSSAALSILLKTMGNAAKETGNSWLDENDRNRIGEIYHTQLKPKAAQMTAALGQMFNKAIDFISPGSFAKREAWQDKLQGDRATAVAERIPVSTVGTDEADDDRIWTGLPVDSASGNPDLDMQLMNDDMETFFLNRTDDPGFSIELPGVRHSLEEMDRLLDHLREVIQRIEAYSARVEQKSILAYAWKLKMEVNRLQECRSRIAATVMEFEEAENTLSELAALVFKES